MSRTIHSVIYGIDHGKHDQTVLALGIRGRKIDFIIVDEIQPLIEDQLAKILNEYGTSSKKPITEYQGEMVINVGKSLRAMIREPKIEAYELRHPEEHGLVRRNGKLVKRHHPIPKTPRSPRKRR